MVEYVAPFAGAWIEMHTDSPYLERGAWSLPSRERGLKYSALKRQTDTRMDVAPFAGAWIEISHPFAVGGENSGRSLRGSVD